VGEENEIKMQQAVYVGGRYVGQPAQVDTVHPGYGLSLLGKPRRTHGDCTVRANRKLLSGQLFDPGNVLSSSSLLKNLLAMARVS
jgi:hypothetical protein